LRAACGRGMAEHIGALMRDIEQAKRLYAQDADWSVESVGYFIQFVLQGSFIFAMAQHSPAVVHANLEHLKRYLNMLFNP
jgi:TetR/AcrR family transcriptional repressor of nem operon